MTKTVTVNDIITQAKQAFELWRKVPAPRRGEVIRTFGQVLRERKETISEAITRDMGKTIRESRGEVQEAIDMCDFAVGLSRQLYGLTMPSERPGHRLQESWQPLGVVAVITAFNFPVAVWSWNFCLAAVAGNSVIWKPSVKGQECASLTHAAWLEALRREDMVVHGNVNQMCYGNVEEARALADSPRVSLVSATGSEGMGAEVGSTVLRRLGKVLLELGGNNASIVSQHADIDMAVKGSVFAAVGTSGQRCTSLRRLIVHSSVIDEVIDRMSKAYATIKIGHPLDEATLMGPLVGESSYNSMQAALAEVRGQGGTIVYGGERLTQFDNDSNSWGPYVTPCIVRTDTHMPIMYQETFAPILYVMPYETLDEAIELANCVRQGLSSSIYTQDVNEAEYFMAESYTGIVNVNTSTSGAEIGGAFGGEKSTGGGRESGSDAWKAYMRRVTSVINYSGELPLAQGIKFE
jgi:aldehyde dehydrogenase (NAD+)